MLLHSLATCLHGTLAHIHRGTALYTPNDEQAEHEEDTKSLLYAAHWRHLLLLEGIVPDVVVGVHPIRPGGSAGTGRLALELGINQLRMLVDDHVRCCRAAEPCARARTSLAEVDVVARVAASTHVAADQSHAGDQSGAPGTVP